MIFAFFLLPVVAATFRSIDLSSSLPAATGFKIEGDTANGYAGNFVSDAGDFNHDGIADLMVAAPYKSNLDGDENAGEVYVLFGKSGSSSFSTVPLASFTASDTTGFKLFGGGADNYLSRVAGLGDFNGDGIDDIAVSAPGASPLGRVNAGKVYVIYGRTSGITDMYLKTFSASSSNGFAIFGESGGDACGGGLISVGDFNGDGRRDLLALRNGNGVSAIAYIIFGTNTRTTDLDLAALTANTDGFRINSGGVNILTYKTGDVNNDGYDDVGVSNANAAFSGRTNAGILNVIFGHSTTTAFPDLSLSAITSGPAAVRIIGPADSARLGICFGPGGDFNHDGLKDLVVGYNSGVYVIFGQRGVASYTDIDMATYLTNNANAGQKFTGDAPYYVGSHGDVDGDGITDIYISDPEALSLKGVFYVMSGHTSATDFTDVVYTPTSTIGLALRVTGGAAGDRLGISTAVSGADYNHDGAPDAIIASAWAVSNSLTASGAAYVIYGVPSPPSSQPSSQPTSQPRSSPSAQPSAQPAAHPSSQPSARPSSQPSSQPSVQPSTQPSVSALQSILASPTYKVRNGFAFAAIGTGGKAEAWGEAPYGGDASAVQSKLNTNVAMVVAARFAFAAVYTDDSLVLWGANVSTAGLGRYGSLTFSVAMMVATEGSFAGVDAATGRVIAVGSKHYGGDVLDDPYCNGYSQQLSAGVRSITASSGAFAAIKMDNTLVCWGNKHAGADVAAEIWSSLVGAKLVVATMSAFAALLSDGTVTSWGDRLLGGDSSAVAGQLREVHHLTASRSCFVAFKKNSGVVVWGYGPYGGDTSAVTGALTSHVTMVAHTFTAMAALKTDGTVVAWGDADAGGDNSAVQASLHNIKFIIGNGRAFAALTSLGGVVAWGSTCCGGNIPSDKVTALARDVVSIHHTDRAFAALQNGGSVVVWGQAGHGGSPGTAVEDLLTSGVHTICANDVAFSAIKTDGKVVAWGHTVSVPTAGVQFTFSNLAAGAQCA